MVGVRANKAHREERIALVFLMTCSGIFVVAIALILGYLAWSGTKLFFVDHVSPLTFLFGTNWDGLEGKFGAATFIVGSLVATGFAILVGGPLGVAIGVFFSELAPKRVAEAFKPQSKFWLESHRSSMVGSGSRCSYRLSGRCFIRAATVSWPPAWSYRS